MDSLLGKLGSVGLVVLALYLAVKSVGRKRVLKDNEKTLKEVSNLQGKKEQLDQQLADEEEKRKQLEKQKKEKKTTDDTNEDLSKYFNDR